MRAVLFFLSLCILLLAGGAYMHAAASGDHPGTDQTSATGHHIRKRMLPVSGDQAGAADAGTDTIECFIGDDLDDEESGSCPAHKYRVAAARKLIAYTHPPLRFIRKYCARPYRPEVSCAAQVCDRYLRQGVLRI